MTATTQTANAESTRPKALRVRPENIPGELKQLPQFVTWQYEWRDKDWTKPPYRVDGSAYADSTDPDTWGPFNPAWSTYEAGKVDGIGVALIPENNIVGVDIDHCIDPETRKCEPWALEIINTLKSYTELSPSGTGVRIFTRGKLPDGRRKKGHVEMYCGGRYLTLTGHASKSTPHSIEHRQSEIEAVHAKFLADEPKQERSQNGNGAWHPSDEEVLAKARDADNGGKFSQLFAGDTSGHNDDDSAADLALCSILAFWTQDAAQIDRIFRRSGLMRDKWDSRRGDSTYGEWTIDKALSGKTDFYSANGSAHGSAGTHDEQNSYNSYNSQTKPQKPVLKSEALYGLAGAIVRAIEPHSEADPVATLVNILAKFGNVVGPTPHARVEETEHRLNTFSVLVGETSKGRKGTSVSTPRKMFRDIDAEWVDKRITSGLSSGEGLVYNVRDPRTQTKPIREDGKVVGYEEVLVDKGEDDKRLFLEEEEFSQALKVMSREGNILSPIIRQAWDHGNLRTLTKNDPNRATGAHISIIAHITQRELLRHLVETEQTNGFANRFCWFLVDRSKEIPRPKGVPAEILSPLTQRLSEAIEFARTVGEIDRDDEANEEWDAVYHDLSEAKPGLTGALIARGEAQVLRLSCLYALLDRSAVIRGVHQRAALAVWDYCEESVKAIFGDMTGDPNVDTAKAALKAKGELTLTELHALFGRNVTSAEVDRVIAALVKMGMATVETKADERGRKSITVLRATNSTNSTNSTGQNS